MPTPLRMTILLTAAFIVGATELAACSCIPPGPPAEELEKAALVFAGEAVRVNPSGGEGPVTVTFRASRVYKGAVKRTIVITTSGSSASCGYGFVSGESYLVYAHGTEDEPVVTICSRTNTLSAAKDDLEALGKGSVPSEGPESVKQ